VSLPAQARAWHELLDCSHYALCRRRPDSCLLLLGGRDLVLLPSYTLSAWIALATVVVRKNPVRPQNQQDTVSLRNVVTWLNSGRRTSKGSVTSWSEQRNKYAIIADHRLAGSRDVDVHGGRDSTPSMGVIVAGIIRRRVGRLSNAAMRAWAPRQERGRRNLPSFGVVGCSYFDAPGPGWVRCNRACEVLVPTSARDACSVVVAFVAIACWGARLPFALIVGYIPYTVCGTRCTNFRRMEPTPRSSRAS
jgi:hypothetical protein